MIFVDESNLYRCIFQSRKSEAEKFQDWVTEEVLPEIRKTGSYSLVPKSYAEALRLYADEVEQRELMQKQRDEAIRTKAYISEKNGNGNEHGEPKIKGGGKIEKRTR